MPRASGLKCFFGCIFDGSLHRFPKWEYPYTEKFDQWKSILDSATQERGNNYIYNSVRICSRHFEDYFNLPSGHLTKNAIPTLNLVMQSAQNIIQPLNKQLKEPYKLGLQQSKVGTKAKQFEVETESSHTEPKSLALSSNNSADTPMIFEELQTLHSGEFQFQNPEGKHNQRTLRREADYELEDYILRRNAWLNAGPAPQPQLRDSTVNSADTPKIFEELETLDSGEFQFQDLEGKHNLGTLRRQEDYELEDCTLKRNAWLNAGPAPQPKPCGCTNSRVDIFEKTPEEAIPRVSGIMRKKIMPKGQQILEAKKQFKKIIPTKRPRNYAKKENFDNITKKLNPLARKLIWMQISQCNKKENGYRFTDEEKAIGLAIWKQNPGAYKFLRSIFILPSLRTMSRVKSKLKVETEKNQHILQTIETEVENEQSQENIDEVFLELGL